VENFKLQNHPIDFRGLETRSLLFDDVFHSIDGKLEEAHFVFIKGNNLLERWEISPKDFTIAELGFGFGISFLVSALEWIKIKNKDCTLNYVGIDGFPISHSDLKKLYDSTEIISKLNNNEKKFLECFLEKYPLLIKGTHRIDLSDFGIQLTLIFDEIDTALKSNNFFADAWFLDGFSPSKNKEMWSKEIFKEINKKSLTNTTFSTYSVSRQVKDNVEDTNFSYKKIEGFGSKNKMLCGKFIENKFHNYPKFKSVAIIGGGLAGLAQAYALRDKDIKITLFEEKNSLGEGASGNKSAVIMPLISSIMDPLSIFYVSGYLHTIRVLDFINKNFPLNSYNSSGSLRLTSVKKWATVAARFEELGLDKIGEVLTAIEINKRFNLIQNNDGIYFTNGGSAEPKEIIESIKNNYTPNTKYVFGTKILNIINEQNKYILSKSDNSTETFDSVIIANAYSCADLNISSWIPIEKIKGQLFAIKKTSKKITFPICYNGYAIPLMNGEDILIGATYEHNNHEEIFNQDICLDLINRFEANTGEKKSDDLKIIDGKVCFRTTSPDRLPVIGPLLDSNGNLQDGIFLNVGHGSRGMVSCFLAGEIIANLMTNSPLAISNSVLESISPARFRNRSLKRNQKIEDIYPESFRWRS